MSNYPPGYDRDAHEDAMGHNDPQPEPPMTAEERLEYLVRLGMQAFDAVSYDGFGADRPAVLDRDGFKDALTERCAQAAQVWTMEVEER